MSPELEVLQAALVRQHQSGLAGGLSDSAARSLVRAMDQGIPLSEAASMTGLDPRIAAACKDAPDLPVMLLQMASLAAELESNTRRLRAAGSYPLLLAISVLIAGLVLLGIAAPALEIVSDTSLVSIQTPLLLSLIAATLLLSVLSLSVIGRLRLPGIGRAWALVEGLAFARSLGLLTGVGVPLPAALRAGVQWGGRSLQRAAYAFARALEAGEDAPDAAPLFDPFEASLLLAAARSGADAEIAQALAEQRYVALARELPRAILWIQIVSLSIAGAAILVVGATFFWIYTRVLVG